MRSMGITIMYHTSNEISITIRRTGGALFDIVIQVYENPALQDDAMVKLDALLSSDNNKSWICSVFPWSTSYEVGISRRSTSGDPKSMDAVLNAWIKSCSQKYGKNLRIEK